MPHREVIDGVLVIFGGAFLITPGFLTDIVGLTLLIPPTRAVVRRQVVRRLDRRVEVGTRPAPPGRPEPTPPRRAEPAPPRPPQRGHGRPSRSPSSLPTASPS